jgi:polysaccharide biosynthesis transport protein
MLQKNTRSDIDDIQPTGADQVGLAEMVNWTIGLLRRQYLVILFVTALGIGVGVLYLKVAPSIYTAETTLYIDPHSSPISAQAAIFGNDPIEINSQIQIIKSKAIAAVVIKKLNLLKEHPTGSGITSSVKEFLSDIGAIAPKAQTDPLDTIIDEFIMNLIVEHTADAGRVVTIKYNSTSPEQAAQVANAVADAYINGLLDAKYESNRLASSWLQEHLKRLREQADQAQRAVESFKRQHNIATADGKALDDQQVADLNSRLITARAQTSEALVRFDRLQALIKKPPSGTDIDAVVSEVNSPTVTSLRQKYLELSQREREWSDRFGTDHLAVVNLRNRMGEIRSSIFDELRLAADQAKRIYATAMLNQKTIEEQLAKRIAEPQVASQAKVTLRGLETTATSYRNLYDSFLQRYMGSSQQTTLPFTEARVISPASPPPYRSKPKTKLILALSIIGSIGLGFGLGILRDIMDRVFRTAQQLETALQVPCVALVPLLKTGKSNYQSRKSTRSNNANGHKVIAPDMLWTIIHSPLSKFAEAVRSIKLAIDLHFSTPGCKVVGITSTVPNEGKSTMAVALAQLIAQGQKRVLLVDCDLRNPSLSRTLAPLARTTIGIAEIISGRSSVKEAILEEPKSKIALLLAGKEIPLFLSSEILGGESISNLFKELRQSYDYIVVDFPPLLPIIDARASTHLVDAYLLTVEWGRTKIDLIEQALASAPKIYVGLIGTILNKIDMKHIMRYDTSGRYDYNAHHARYGYTD